MPANLAHFRTDLTSVPAWFTWLVPRTGVHLPAALIHDGLILSPGEPQTYIASQVIERETADRSSATPCATSTRHHCAAG